MPDILEVIDGALADCSTSGDAMRWSPEPPRVICDGGDVLWPERYSILRHGTYRMGASAIDLTGMQVEFTRFTERLAADMLPVMVQAFDSLTMTFQCSAHAFDGLFAAFGWHDEHRRAELSRMHREYRRRSLARQRKRR